MLASLFGAQLTFLTGLQYHKEERETVWALLAVSQLSQQPLTVSRNPRVHSIRLALSDGQTSPEDPGSLVY